MAQLTRVVCNSMERHTTVHRCSLNVHSAAYDSRHAKLTTPNANPTTCDPADATRDTDIHRLPYPRCILKQVSRTLICDHCARGLGSYGGIGPIATGIGSATTVGSGEGQAPVGSHAIATRGVPAVDGPRFCFLGP